MIVAGWDCPAWVSVVEQSQPERTTHARTIDVAEADGLESPRVRLAFEVEDTSALTDRLVQDGGAELLAAPVLTPWRSVNSRLAAPR